RPSEARDHAPLHGVDCVVGRKRRTALVEGDRHETRSHQAAPPVGGAAGGPDQRMTRRDMGRIRQMASWSRAALPPSENSWTPVLEASGNTWSVITGRPSSAKTSTEDQSTRMRRWTFPPGAASGARWTPG